MRRGAILGLAAAALFGLSTPLAKVLLGSVSPILLAGLLYLGAAAGLWLHRLARPTTSEAPLQRDDISKLSGVVIAGGILVIVTLSALYLFEDVGRGKYHPAEIIDGKIKPGYFGDNPN